MEGLTMQALRRRLGLVARDEGGQSLAFVAMMLFVMFLFVCVTADVGDFVAQRVDAQNDADAMAISTAVWQSRGLNLVQTLNIAKNLAHVHYMGEFAEVLYWLVQLDIPMAFTAAFVGPESLSSEKDDLETELRTLSLIQTYIAGVNNREDGYDMEDYGSTKNFIKAAIPIVDTANNNGSFHTWSVALNEAAATGLVYDANLKIDFVHRNAFYQIICELLGVDCDSWFLDLIADLIEVDFSWAVQSSQYENGQYTVGFAMRDLRPAPMFGGSFQSKSIVSQIFGDSDLGWFFRTDVHLAVAQAKSFKPDPYSLRPGTATNGMAANLLGLPFATIFGSPTGNNQAYWDVKLTPVTILQRWAPPLAPLMTH
jgi:hypothetical protein